MTDANVQLMMIENGRVIYVGNRELARQFGYTDAELDAHPALLDIIHPQDREWVADNYRRRLAGEDVPTIYQVGLVTRDGKRRDFEIAIAIVPDTAPVRMVTIGIDITERKRIEDEQNAREMEYRKKIHHQANYDSLTGLPNRELFRDHMEHAIKHLRNEKDSLALLFIDIDGFKMVNDIGGHHLGDQLLVWVARCISDCVREGDTVARFSGDEFTVLLHVHDDQLCVEQIAERIRHRISQPFMLDENMIYTSVSIGIAQYPANATDAETLLKHADQAMYVAKAQEGNCYHYFTDAMEKLAQNSLLLSRDLHGALAAHQFMVYYQPIVDLASNHWVKAEALLRWLHPTRGLVGPDEFIPLAEKIGLISEIGFWTLQQSVEQVRLWIDQNAHCVQVCVNKSPREFTKDRHHQNWPDYLDQSGLPTGSVIVEITEGILIDDRADVAEELLRYRDAGVQVSLDDFGTGYSAMSYLHKYHIDFIKIDKSFVCKMVDHLNDQAIVDAIIAMAHKLGMKVIAEGVETVEQRDLLLAANCDYAQGYFFARPMPASDFLGRLKEGPFLAG